MGPPQGAEDELGAAFRAFASRHGGSSGSASRADNSSASAAGGDWRFDWLRSVGEECQTEAELRGLIERKPDFQLYDGFEPSGRMHIAQGVFKAINVNKCTKAGGTFIFWVADWFALMNDKMGGDLEKIKTVGKYLIEVWKAGGMDMSRVKFLWSSDEISGHAKEYWGQALDIARLSTLSRIKRCCQIMGRQEDKLTAAQIMYPIMQCTDIFFLRADICQLGVDQRKVNMLARDYCDLAGRKSKPVVLSHHMLYGLKAGQAKMSKSDPDSAIFMEDGAEDVERKITNAYCPLKPEASAQKSADDEMHLVKDELMNPCLDYAKHILFSRPGYTFPVEGKTYESFEAVKTAFLSGAITEQQLKRGLIDEVNSLLEPVRQHFQTNSTAKELLAKITAWKKENLTAPTTLTCMKAVESGSAPVFAVFAPLPSGAAVQVDAVLSLLERLRAPPTGSQVILWLEVWSARTLGCFGGSESCVLAWYEVLLGALRALGPQVMQNVRVCWQGEAILSAPSEYWISVINAGRRSSLDEIRSSLAVGDSLEYASQVFASLMHIGDVLALTPASGLTLCCDAQHERLHGLAASHCKALGLNMPEVRLVETSCLRLAAAGEGAEVDVNLFVSDKEQEVSRKVKKAFCEPGNIQFCPPISVVAAMLPLQTDFTVFRKPENGGDQVYSELPRLREDFASGALHPGDLKPAMAKAVNALLEPVRAELASSQAAQKAVKELENYTKAQTKQKKK